MEGPGLGGFVAAHMAQLVSVLNTNIEIHILDLESDNLNTSINMKKSCYAPDASRIFRANILRCSAISFVVVPKAMFGI